MKTIDAIIPTIPGREDSLERLLSSLRAVTANPLTEIIVKDSETCGWGWRKGLESTRADYVLLACDDQEFIGDAWDEAATAAVDQGFLPCPRVWMPNGGIASQGGDMRSFAHIIQRPQKDWTPVDYTTIPFMSREQAERIGMLPVHYCSDVWVSYRGRQLGYETCLRHGYDVVHYEHPVGRGAGMSVSQRDGMDEATMRKELIRCEYLSPAASAS